MNDESAPTEPDARPDVEAHYVQGARRTRDEVLARDHPVRPIPDDAPPEERLAAVLSLLPPAPEAWVEAAKQFPVARSQINSIVARAERDAEYRSRLVADPERALAADGIEWTPVLRRELGRRLAAD